MQMHDNGGVSTLLMKNAFQWAGGETNHSFPLSPASSPMAAGS